MSPFAALAADMQEVVYATHGIPAVWTPKNGGVPQAVILLEDKTGDVVDGFGVEGRFVSQQRRYRMRTSDADPEQTGARPVKGDGVTIGDESLTIQPSPRQADDHRLEWTFELG